MLKIVLLLVFSSLCSLNVFAIILGQKVPTSSLALLNPSRNPNILEGVCKLLHEMTP